MNLKDKLKEAYRTYTNCKKEFMQASEDEKQQERELALAQFEVDEISNARLVVGEDEELVNKLIEKAKGPKEEMLDGVVEQLTVLRDKYSEDSYGHEALHAIIVDMNGGEKYGS